MPAAAGLVCVLSLVFVGAGVGDVRAQGASGGRASGGPQMMGPWKWWNDASVQKELGLSAQKVKDIDNFYEKRSKDLKPMADELERQRQELDNMTKAAVADESVYALQVLRVESLQARLRESRTMMLYRMFRSLQPDQYRKLQDLLDRRYGRSSNTAPGRGRE
jgi:Spy/CpxP family protein refolding chaperone